MKISALKPSLDTTAGVALLLAIYAVVFLLLRLAISPTVGVDDVEQAVLAQGWRLVYNPEQPPVFTWMVLGLSKLFGPGLFTFSLLRYALLFLTYLFLYLVARDLIEDRRLAALGALSPIYIYYVGWGAHLGFTHTALLAVACGGTAYAFLRLIRTGAWGDYLALGLMLALGFNSKYNYGVLAAGLVFAGLLQPLSRRRILNPRFGICLASAVVLTVPPLLWVAREAGSAQAFMTIYTHQDVPYHGSVPRGLVGLWSMVRASAGFISPWWLVVLPLFPQGLRGLKQRAVKDFDAGRLLGHALLFAYALLVVGALSGKLTHFSVRWMHPVLLLLPVYYFYRVGRAGSTERQARRFQHWLLGAAIVTAVLFGIQGPVGPLLCGKCRWFEPYPKLADKLAAAGFTGGTIVAADENIAGNFRARFPDSRVIALPYARYLPPPRSQPGQCALVWDRKISGDSVPPPLADLLKSRLEFQLSGQAPVAFISAVNPALHDRPLTLAYMVLPGAGGCH